MVQVFHFIKSFFAELFIIFLLILCINNYIGNVDQTIKADGIGYYDYLPSVFIHHDLDRRSFDQKLSPEEFERIKSLGVYVNYKGSMVNKYTCGTALLDSPFFLATYFFQNKSESPNNGYQASYQHAILYAALFYLFLALFFFKKILQLYKCSYSTILLSQLLIVFATSVTNYANFDASYSHINSLFAISAFIYFTKLYFENRKFSTYYLACAMLGLIIILRPVNGMIIFFIPFLAGSFRKLKEEFIFLLSHFLKTFAGILLIAVILSIQCLLWYFQTGSMLIYTYGNEGFNFLNPEVSNVLFSYRKGLFVYTPVLLLTMAALIWLGIKRKFYELFTWLGFFVLITYVISSWWCWFYGGSYGLRAYVDFYTIFFILFALMFDKLAAWLKILFIIPAIIFAYINVIQTYQYKEFILHWGDMDKAKYWTVFLKTGEPYKGMVWKRQYDYMQYQKIEELAFGDFTIPAHKDSTIALIHSSNLENAVLFQVGISNDFREDNDGGILLLIKEIKSDSVVFWHQRYLQHFNEKGLNQYNTGLFNYELPAKLSDKDYELKIVTHSASKSLDLKNVKLTVFKK